MNVPLAELGTRQAQALAQHFATLAAAGETFDAIYASPLDRARLTAEPIAERLGLPLRLDDRLKELNAGVFAGLVWSEIEANHPAAAASWKTLDPDFRIPEGESRRDLMRRAESVLTSILAEPLERTIIVAHGGLLSAGLKALLGVPAERNPFMLYNGSISILDQGVQLKLRTLNQIDHLQLNGERLLSRLGDL